MKSTYEARAAKFAEYLCKLFSGCYSLEQFEKVIRAYNLRHSIHIKYEHGVSRIAIIRADYVIKFNVTPEEGWIAPDGSCWAGDNASEREVYLRAMHDGYAHLLAKTTVLQIRGRNISIMPRIANVGDEERDWYETMQEDEREWVLRNIGDIHPWNVGYVNGKAVIIDYAWKIESM